MTAIPTENASESELLPGPEPVPAETRARMVIGITTDQTCLVLRGRLSALQSAGFDVTLISAPGEILSRFAAEEGASSIPLPMRRGISPLADVVSFLTLCRILWRLQPAITDFSTPKAGLLGNLAAWCLGVPHRVYTLRGLKMEGARGFKRGLLLCSEWISARCTQVVLCNSVSLLTRAKRLGIAPEKKLRLMGDGSSNGVDTERFSPGVSGVRREFGILDRDLVVGFVGRLTKDKGVPELVEAFESILRVEPRSWLLLVGWFDRAEDALHARWREKIAKHPRIRHTGFVTDTAAYYRAMDVFVLPTHREGFPNVALEAAACGLAVITTESTGARDAVLPEITGLLIPPRIPEAISDAVLALLKNGEKRKRFGDAGRDWVVKVYSKERVLGLAVDFYRGLLGANTGKPES